MADEPSDTPNQLESTKGSRVSQYTELTRESRPTHTVPAAAPPHAPPASARSHTGHSPPLHILVEGVKRMRSCVMRAETQTSMVCTSGPRMDPPVWTTPLLSASGPVLTTSLAEQHEGQPMTTSSTRASAGAIVITSWLPSSSTTQSQQGLISRSASSAEVEDGKAWTTSIGMTRLRSGSCGLALLWPSFTIGLWPCRQQAVLHCLAFAVSLSLHCSHCLFPCHYSRYLCWPA